MNDRPHNERLLADILGEGSAADRRDALLGETLRLARRRRHFRQGRRAASALALVAAGLLVIWRQTPPRVVLVDQPKPYILVRTQSLPKAAIVETQPLSAASLISSVPTRGILSTAGASLDLHEINDDELLALASPAPAVLVRSRPGVAELVFVSSVRDKANMSETSPDQL